MTLREALDSGIGLIQRSGSSSPHLDASLLLSAVLGVDRVYLYAHALEELGDTHLRQFQQLLDRRHDGECVAYILGTKEFHGMDFIVSPDVLVPRPDTETLVDWALDLLGQRSLIANRPLRVLDACTGSGCIAVSIKAGFPDCDLAASDISEAALDIARRNAETLLPQTDMQCKPIRFIRSDLLTEVQGMFDLIVSNPPYVPSDQIDRLSAEVRREPRLALDGGPDGLDLIEHLVPQAAVKLNSGGQLLIEAGSEQADRIERLFTRAGFVDFTRRRDLEGRERVFGGSIP